MQRKGNEIAQYTQPIHTLGSSYTTQDSKNIRVAIERNYVWVGIYVIVKEGGHGPVCIFSKPTSNPV